MFLTKEKYNEEAEKYVYWKAQKEGRWEYMSWVINRMKELGAEKICEAGANRIPLNSKSYLITQNEAELVNESGRVWDLNETPYSFKDDTFFDCFVALQVWEHLINQAEAFQEALRISKYVILSFPYEWETGDSMHKGIQLETIRKWTKYKLPLLAKIITSPEGLKRYIGVW